jgi:hypothetical protein
LSEARVRASASLLARAVPSRIVRREYPHCGMRGDVADTESHRMSCNERQRTETARKTQRRRGRSACYSYACAYAARARSDNSRCGFAGLLRGPWWNRTTDLGIKSPRKRAAASFVWQKDPASRQNSSSSELKQKAVFGDKPVRAPVRAVRLQFPKGHDGQSLATVTSSCHRRSEPRLRDGAGRGSTAESRGRGRALPGWPAQTRARRETGCRASRTPARGSPRRS